MQLILDSRPQHDFNAAYHELLIRSKLFTDIRYERLPEHDTMLELDKVVYPKGREHKRGQVSFARVDGKLIAFDTQFNDRFSISYLKSGLLEKTNCALYVKYSLNPEVQACLPCKLVNWVIFPSGFGLVEKFKWDLLSTHQIVMASGKHSLLLMDRTKWFDKGKQLQFNTQIAIPQNQYASLLQTSKWGVILSIRNEKNTREYEFISCLMPLALNYIPSYSFPFEPNEHYFYMPTVDSMEQLYTIDPTPYHVQSKWLWDNYLRPDKAVEMLLAHI